MNSLLDELDEDLMFELDEVVRENQRRCFPNSRSGTQEQWLLKKYPELFESQEREKEALIAFYVAQEDEPLPSSFKKVGSCPPETISGSPPQQIPNRERRKSSKEGKLVMSISPSLKSLNPGGDLMFDMDEEDAVLSAGLWDNNGKNIYPSPPSSLPQPDEGTWFNAKGKAIVFPPPSAQDTPGKTTIDVFVTPKSSLRKQLSTPGWASAESWRSSVSEKSPMREIIAQASSLGKSSISSELSTTLEKVSQKERKRQQQQQQQTVGSSAVPIVPIPEKQITRMWATPTAVSRVSLKKVIMEESSSPHAASEKIQTQGAVSALPSAPQRSPSPTPLPVAAQTRTIPAVSTPSHLHPPVPRRSEATLHLSLADIMSQEEMHKEIMRDHAAKRSLQEIQVEQEFLRWWDIESEKVRLETAAVEAVASRGSGGRRGGGGGKRGGKGRGGRRGRGESVATGQGGRGEAVVAGRGGRP